MSVEAESQFTVRPLLALQRLDPLRPIGCLHGVFGRHAALERAGVDLHAAKLARARRIASERDT